MKTTRFTALSLLFGLLWVSSPITSLSAQTINGDAADLCNNCYRITRDTMWVAGSVWFPDTLRLDRPFNIRFNANFGGEDVMGADGIAFVLHGESANRLSGAGGELGWSGISPSFGFEFDTFENPTQNDPVYDHFSAFFNGSNLHGGTQELSGPVGVLPAIANIEDVQEGWNGMISGENAPNEVYYCVVRTRDCKEELMEVAGYFSLIR